MKSKNGSSYINSIQPKSDALSLRAMRYSNSSSNLDAGITYKNQEQLPRLPIPTLNETLSKLPSRLQALIDEKELKETKIAIDAFLQNEGPLLQEKLIEYGENGFNNKEIGSYVEEFWNESYLQPDISTVLNLNPFFILEDSPDPKIGKDQLRRAASLCFASIKFASSLRNETLEPDYIKGTPLCMDQFKVLFGSSRQPVMRLDTNQDDVHVYDDSTHGT
jgi:carnitine O-acetyltransferase